MMNQQQWVLSALLGSALVANVLVPQQALAKWYNPASWFRSSTPTITQPAQPQKNETAKPADPMAMYNGAVITTERGKIVVSLYEKQAPITVTNFKKLVNDDFYNTSGMVFHRVVDDFVVQTGDPTGTGYGGSGKSIPLEVDNRLSHDSIGILSMARGPLPNSATSQFFITLDKQKSLDGKYAVFGEVIQGLDILKTIRKGDRVYGIELKNIDGLSREDRKNFGKEDKKLLGMF